MATAMAECKTGFKALQQSDITVHSSDSSEMPAWRAPNPKAMARGPHQPHHLRIAMGSATWPGRNHNIPYCRTFVHKRGNDERVSFETSVNEENVPTRLYTSHHP